MNRGNGGRQKKNSDTVVPENVPEESMRNQVQEMTTKDGLVKGLEQVLKVIAAVLFQETYLADW